MAISKVPSKGAVVIPLSIRKKFQIDSGMRVNIIETNGTIRIVPIPRDPIKALPGSLKFQKTALEMKQEIRKEELILEKQKWDRIAKKQRKS